MAETSAGCGCSAAKETGEKLPLQWLTLLSFFSFSFPPFY
jgi:hypothetical protein